MSELPFAILKSVNQYKPIDIDGLRFYPIRVNDYEAFLAARPGIEVMQQALPMRLVSLPLLAALYKLDYDAIADGEAASGLFSRALLFLALSLRLGEGRETEERMKLFRIAADPNDPSKLKSVRFPVGNGELYDLTPVKFARYRPIIAAQNGVALEADDANPELVQSERDIQSMNGPKLELRLEDMISAVSAMCGADEAEVYDWPILKLDRRKTAFQRVIDYIVCGINQGAGCSWKGGNPVPSLWFDRVKDGSAALMPLGDFAGGAAERAVGNPGQKVS